MTFQSSIVEKMNTFFGEVIHIMPKCVVHLHGHQNEMMPLMKPIILMNLNDGIKCHNYIFCTSHVKIDL
jgi:hypothetical protein